METEYDEMFITICIAAGHRTRSLLLRRDGHSQLVYKHAISTIMPAQPISLHEGEE